MSTRQNKYAVLIGIDKYHESLGSLKYAGADCRRLKDVLLSGNLGFAADKMLLLDDTQSEDHRPTFANIHTWLSSWLAQPKEDDLVLFYFAGHGRDMDGKSYLVPGDATLSTLHTLGIPLANIQELVGRCKARNKILVVDACHSGAGRDVAPMSANWQNKLAQSKGIYTITSCGVDELSHEWDEKSQGVFSWFLAEALSGACAPNPDGKLTIEHIYEWVHEKVAGWSAQHRCKQTPQRFYRGSGTITLVETEPDYKAIVQQMQHELAKAQKELLDMKLKEAKKEQIAYSKTTVHKRRKKGQKKAADSLHSPFDAVKSARSIVVKCEHCNGAGVCRNDQASSIRGDKGIACLVCWKKADAPGDLRQPITCSVCGGIGKHTLVKPIEKCLHCNGRGVCLNDTDSFLRGRTPIPCIPCWKAAGSPGDLKRVVPCDICKGVGSVVMGES